MDLAQRSHHLVNGRIRPARAFCFCDFVRRDEPLYTLSVTDQEAALSGAQQIFVHERLQVIVAAHHGTVVLHQVADAHAAQPLANLRLRSARACRLQQEPTYKGYP